MSTPRFLACVLGPVELSREPPKNLLSDLGKATKRGVRRCPKCGTYNGTRRFTCKNKHCDVVFKDGSESTCVSKSRRSSHQQKQRCDQRMDAVRLISGASKKVFSVSVCARGDGKVAGRSSSDPRGFVQLMPCGRINNYQSHQPQVALCFVDSCQRSFDDSILRCHETSSASSTSTCLHIRTALGSETSAEPVETKTCLLASLGFDDSAKQGLWDLYSKTEGPLVQRISEDTMAVRCQVSPKHPLGYLHVTFHKSPKRFFRCGCDSELSLGRFKTNQEDIQQRCVHFYACVWAFCGHVKIRREFADFLNIFLEDQHKHERFVQHDLTKKTEIEFNFEEWLSTVIERINLSLSSSFLRRSSYENLSYYVPMQYVKLLTQKFVGCKNVECIDPKNSTYSPETSCLICDVSELKQIFNTSQVSLRINQLNELPMKRIRKDTDVIEETTRGTNYCFSFLKVGLATTTISVSEDDQQACLSSRNPFLIRYVANAQYDLVKIEFAYQIGYCDAKRLYEYCCGNSINDC